MTLTRGSQRTLIGALFAVLAIAYVIAWRAPAVGLLYEDGATLLSAQSLASGHASALGAASPPLFPSLLALFLLVSDQPQWLKTLPLLCTGGWFWLSYKLLRKMGASEFGALLIVGVTAASPNVIASATNLLAQPLFALLATAALLALLNNWPLLGGALAACATLNSKAGIALIVACILIFVVRGRFRSASLFSAAAILPAAPWLGWALAHGRGDFVSLTVLTGLHANEKAIVVATNFLTLLTSPFALLTGITSWYAAVATAVLIVWGLIRRRQLVPDLFLLIYCLMLLCCILNPQPLIAAVLPLVLWLLWRAFHSIRYQEALTACVLILLCLALWASFRRLPATLNQGEFTASAQPPNDWTQMRILFAYLRANTPEDAVLMADLAPLFRLNTGHKTVRGFTPDNFLASYAASGRVVRPEQLTAAVRMEGVNYVIITPDRDIAESASYRASVEALERGGALEPLAVPGLEPRYRLLAVKLLNSHRS